MKEAIAQELSEVGFMLVLRLCPLRNRTQIDNRRPFSRLFHQITNQPDYLELGIDHVQTRRVTEEIEHGFVIDGPFHGGADGIKEPL